MPRWSRTVPNETELQEFLDELELAASNAISRETSRYSTLELMRVRSLIEGFRGRVIQSRNDQAQAS